jgi:O-antigen/teichoic acid export membrane protein
VFEVSCRSIQSPDGDLRDDSPQPPPDAGALAIRGGALRVVGFVCGVLVSLGSAAVLVRHLGIADFGRFVTVTSLVALVSGLTEAGIVVYGIREYATRTDTERRELMANLLAMRLTLAAVGVACAVAFGVSVGYRDVLVIGTFLAGLGLLVQVVADVLSVPLQARLRLGRLSLIDLTRRIVALVLIGGLALMDAKLLPFLAVSIFSGGLALLLLARMVKPSLAIAVRFDRDVWRGIFAETLPFAVAISIGAIYFYVTVIVMSLIATPLQTGLFGTAFRVTQVALAIPTLLLTAIFPLISRQAHDDVKFATMLGKVYATSAICGVWLSLCIALGAGLIIELVAGSAGHAAASVLRIQAIVLTVSFLSSASVFALLSLRRYRAMLLATPSALVLNILLVAVLVPPLGARGGAMADVLTATAVAVGLVCYLLRISAREQIGKAFIPPLVVAAVLASCAWLIPFGSVARVIAATIIYFGVLLAAGAIPAEVTRALSAIPFVRSIAVRNKRTHS